MRFSAEELLDDSALPTSVSKPVGDGCSWGAESLIEEAGGSDATGGEEVGSLDGVATADDAAGLDAPLRGVNGRSAGTALNQMGRLTCPAQ